MARDLFDSTIQRTLAELPAQFREHLDNVEILVEHEWAEDPHIYGLYEGVPLPERTVDGMDLSGPDRIYVFRRPLVEDFGGDARELVHEIRVTLLHELAHHFGIDDARLVQLGWG